MRYNTADSSGYTPVFRPPRVGRRRYGVAPPRTGLRYGTFPITPESGELERESPGTTIATDTAVAQLGSEWSRRRNGSPSPEAMTQWLLRDREDTLAGALRRWRKGQYTPEAVSNAWLVSRREQMRFQTEWPSGLKRLQNFAPPAQPITLVSSPLIKDSNQAKVAPLLVRFVQELRQRYPTFDVWNYTGHGGGTFHNRGFSLDLAIPRRDARGFYPPEETITFLRAMHQSAHRVGAEWRVLYNDFTVADALNRETGVAHVFFMGTVRRNAAKAVTGLNWHGPHPLILHFHLDLAPGSRVVGTPLAPGSTASSQQPARPPASSSARPSATARRPRTGARDDVALVALEIAKRQVPGMPGTTLERLIEQWRPRICPEVPLPVLLAFMRYESGGRFDDATHGTKKNRWTVPDFYELGLFQTPAGLHGRCTSGDWRSCEHAPPGRETARPSPWKRLCARIGADPNDWKNPTAQVRVGLMDLEDGAKVLRKDFPDLLPKPGTDWDIRMAVLYRFARGGGYARSFLLPHRQQLAAMPENQRWAFLWNKVVTVKGTKGPIRRPFHGDNVEKKMVLAARLGYVPA